MSYPDSVRFLYQLGNELKSARYDLARMEIVLDALGSPQRKPARFVHVAGTNGKGSTCAMIESGLRASGLRTGLFTSPHLAEPTERIRIDGVSITPERFAAAFGQVHQVAETLLESGKLDLHPSYFETVTAMALIVFREEPVDIAVIEVGLGGRLDATNLVEPELCVITPVDFDHEAFLGKSIESIAFEKAGILKPHVPAVVARQRGEAKNIIAARALETHSRLIDSTLWTISDLAIDAECSQFLLSGDIQIEISCPLAGHHQVENARTAVCALHALQIAEEDISDGLVAARWPGRLEHIGRFVIDGAHNPAGARALADYLREFYGGRQKTLIFGAMRDKSVDEMAGALFPEFDQVIVTAPDQPRSLDPATFAEISDHPALTHAPTLREAIGCAEAFEGAIFITGSLFLVAEARALLL
jgi:dihydrofolate synthase/folylpolyglutamate synthase